MSVRLRLAAALVSLVLVVGLAFAAVVQRSLGQSARDRLVARLEADARLTAELLGAAPFAAEQRAAIQEGVGSAGRATGMRVTLIAADGTVVADSDVSPDALGSVENHAQRPEVAAALGGRVGRDERRSGTVGRTFLYLAVPIESGALRLAADSARVEAEVGSLARALVVAGAAGLALAAALSAGFAALLTRRVHELEGVVKAIAAGDLSQRLPWRSGDELGAIARAIDDMAQQLRRRLEQANDEQARLRAVLQGMVEGVLVLDKQGRVILANPRLRELFGVWGGVEGRSALEVVRRTDVEAALTEASGASEPVVRELQLDAGRGRRLQMHAVRIPSRGPLLGTVAVFHDTTEIHRLEGLRREFVANVSHELRTPLTAIRGFAETLRSSEVSPEQRRQFLDVILRHADRLTALIEDLLELSRIEGGSGALAPEPVDVAALARELLQDLKPRLDAGRLRGEVRAEPAPPALADRRALEQVLMNLLDNAIKYSEAGGRIQIAVSGSPTQIRIDVVDTGMGIPEADRARIFERFYRVDKARSRDLGGTGLGLAIVKHLVQTMGGEVFVTSNEGQGSTFSVRLPAARIPEPERVSGIVTDSSPKGLDSDRSSS
jgi:two-component system phosphate regulon sensor histidine kinase PhoR